MKNQVICQNIKQYVKFKICIKNAKPIDLWDFQCYNNFCNLVVHLSFQSKFNQS